MRGPLGRATAGVFAVAAMVAACASFGTATTGSDDDGGAPDEAARADGSDAGDSNDGCSDWIVATFASTDDPAGFTKTTQNGTVTVEAVDGAVNGNALAADIMLPVGGGSVGWASVAASRAGVPRHATVSYSLRFDWVETYAEVGCAVLLAAGTSPLAGAFIQHQPQSTSISMGVSTFAGDGGAPEAASLPLGKIQIGQWHDVEIALDGVDAIRTFTIALTPRGTTDVRKQSISLPVPPNADTLSVSCGIRYASAAGESKVDIDGIHARACD